MLLRLSLVDLSHDLLLLKLLDLLLFRKELFLQLLCALTMLKLCILHLCLSFLTQMLLELLD